MRDEKGSEIFLRAVGAALSWRDRTMSCRDVDISLSLGQLIWGKNWAYVIGLLLLSVIFPLLTVIMLFFPMTWDNQMIAAIVLADVFSVLLSVIPLYLFCKDKRNKKKVCLWLEDAREVLAYCEKTGEGGMPGFPKGSTVRVSFELDGKLHTKDSSLADVFGRVSFLASYNKYVGRKITIYYSPAFDEVMIPKQNL